MNGPLPDRVDGDLGVDVAGDLCGVHVGDVLEVAGEAVVLHDERVEHIGEVDVAVLVAGVDPAVLQGVQYMCSNSNLQGRAKKILLSWVTHVPSGLMGCALAA